MVGDDAFRQPPQHLIAAAWIVEVSLSHVDGALMVASHLFDECEVYLGGAWIELPVRSDDMKIANQPNTVRVVPPISLFFVWHGHCASRPALCVENTHLTAKAA